MKMLEGWELDREKVAAKEMEMDLSWKSNGSFSNIHHMCWSRQSK